MSGSNSDERNDTKSDDDFFAKSTERQLSMAGVMYANSEEGTRIIDEIKHSGDECEETSLQLLSSDNDETVYTAQEGDTKTVSSDED
jgi:hypothetical protein